MNEYLMKIWRILYALGTLLVATIAMGVIYGLILVVGLAIGWAFNLLMDAIFHGTPYTQIDEDDDT